MWYFYTMEYYTAIFKTDIMKFARTKMELGNDKQPQLYDLSSDPSEKTDVAKQYPDIVKELSALLETVKE